MSIVRFTTPLLALMVAVMVLTADARLKRKPRSFGSIPQSRMHDDTRPSVVNCTERFYQQRLDHFNFAKAPVYFNQRYFTCLEDNWKPGNPIFFYTGNEVDVVLFVNMTGLMWENAAKFGAMLIFAEHRYFGKSLPFPNSMPTEPEIDYLTTDQALADYATLIDWFKLSKNAPDAAVIGFGGSYGGMLCAWLRIKYPSALNGCIAGSAPIINFERMRPSYDYFGFNDAVTYDASTAGGANDLCKDNVRTAFQDIMELAKTASGLAEISSAFQLCHPLQYEEQAMDICNKAENAFGNMAMSSYPYPSTYLLLGGGGILPAYPMRVGCKFMTKNFTSRADRISGLKDMVGVYYNNTGTNECFHLHESVNMQSEITGYLWDYLYCSTMYMPFSTNGVTDMFWLDLWNSTAQREECQEQWQGTTPQADWVQINYGGRGVSQWGSNIVFSNGGLDPWRPGGIQAATAVNVTTIIIPDVGHHIDLFFSSPEDTPAIKAARALEVQRIGEWIANKDSD